MLLYYLLYCLHVFIHGELLIPIFLSGVGRMGDTSQKGNWSCFRNGYLNSSKAVNITVASFHEIPKIGQLEFDFVAFKRPLPEIASAFRPVSNKRLFSVLEECSLMVPEERVEGKFTFCKDLKVSL